MNKDVLQQVRAALDAGPLAERRLDAARAETERGDPARPRSSGGRLFPADLDEPALIALFTERAESSGARVHRAVDRAGLKAIIHEIVGDGAKLALATNAEGGDGGQSAPAADDLVPDPCTIVPISDTAGDDLFRIDAAITDVDLAVAETGSIVLGASGACRRMISLVPLIHIALVRPDQIVADLIDWAGTLPAAGDDAAPGGLTLISGPSKTADIEIKLVTGVHGPGELHLVVVEDLARDDESRDRIALTR